MGTSGGMCAPTSVCQRVHSYHLRNMGRCCWIAMKFYDINGVKLHEGVLHFDGFHKSVKVSCKLSSIIARAHHTDGHETDDSD